MIIGLCGGSGSGKSTVGELFSEFNYLNLNTDAIYHSLISQKSECRDAIVSEFGRDILSGEGIDRRALSSIVFGDKSGEALKRLNQISHKFVLDEVRRRAFGEDGRGFDGVIVDAPLLFESGFNEECDFVISVIADRETRIERIIKRDSISKERAIERISKQISDEELISRSNFVIYNDGNIECLKEKIKIIINEMKEGN